jgi:hypothetical protein
VPDGCLDGSRSSHAAPLGMPQRAATGFPVPYFATPAPALPQKAAIRKMSAYDCHFQNCDGSGFNSIIFAPAQE